MIALNRDDCREIPLFKLLSLRTLLLSTAAVAVGSAGAKPNQEPDRQQVVDLRSESFEDRAFRLFEANQFTASMALTNRWIAACPHDGAAYRMRGLIYLMLEQPEKALVALDQSAKFSVAAGTIQYRAIALSLLGRYSELHTTALEYLNNAPRSVIAYELVSTADALVGSENDAILYLGRFSAARMHGGSVLHSSQHQAQSKYWDGTSFREGVMSKDTRRTLLAQLKNDHKGLSIAEYMFARAVLLFYQREYDQALVEAASWDAGSTQVYSETVSFYCQIFKRNFPKARQILNHLIELAPTSEATLDAVDLYHFESDQRQAGIAEIAALLKKDSKNSAALSELTRIYQDLSQPEPALFYCDKALKLEPKNVRLRLLRANILTSQEKYAEALAETSTIIALDGKNAAAYMARATIRTQQGNLTAAVDDLTKVLDLKYDLTRALRARAACYQALKRQDLAIKDMHEARLQDRGGNFVGTNFQSSSSLPSSRQ